MQIYPSFFNVQVYIGSSSDVDYADWGWCYAPETELIEGMQIPGGIYMSPIEVTTAPLQVKESQKRFYEAAPKIRMRSGPVVDDATRMTETIPYERSAYSYPVSLVSPPILLQKRVETTATCSNRLGSIYLQKIWNQTAQGVTCELPYECDEALLKESTSLMSCSSAAVPEAFFGQRPMLLGGELQFYEFLQVSKSWCLFSRHHEPYALVWFTWYACLEQHAIGV